MCRFVHSKWLWIFYIQKVDVENNALKFSLTCVSSSIAHTVTVVTAGGVHTLAPLTGLMLALIDVHLTGRTIPTLHQIETKHSYHKLYMKKKQEILAPASPLNSVRNSNPYKKSARI